MDTSKQRHRVGHAPYVSEFTRYMDQFLEERPDVVADQRRGWHIFWDRDVDLEELKKANEDTVPPKNYYYS